MSVMSKRPINNEVIDDTGFGFTLSLINGKYKMSILYCLTDSLKGLEKDGMTLRTDTRRFLRKWNIA